MDGNTPTSIILISAFIGSASGIVLSKLIEISQAKRQHKLNLQKLVFERKVDVFEKTASFWNNTQSMVQSLNNTFKSVSNPNHYFNDQTTENIINSITKDYSDVTNESKMLTASLTLYIDLPAELYVSPILGKLFQLYGEIGFLIAQGEKKVFTEEQFRSELQVKLREMNDLTQQLANGVTKLVNYLRYDIKSL